MRYNANTFLGHSVSLNKSATKNSDYIYGVSGSYNDDPNNSFVSLFRLNKSQSYNPDRVLIINASGTSLDITPDDKYFGKIFLLSNDAHILFIAYDKNIFIIHSSGPIIDSGRSSYQLYDTTTNHEIIESMAINNDGSILVIGKPNEDKICIYKIRNYGESYSLEVDLINTIIGNSGDYFGNSISMDNTNIITSSSIGGYIKRYQTTNNWANVSETSIDLGKPILNLNISGDGSKIIYTYNNNGNNEIGLLENNVSSLNKLILNSNYSELVTNNFIQALLNYDGNKIIRIINNNLNQEESENKVNYYNIENLESTNKIIINNNSYNIFINSTNSSIQTGTNSKSITLNSNSTYEIYIINDRLFYNNSWSKIN